MNPSQNAPKPDLGFRARQIVNSLDARGAWLQKGDIGQANRVVGLTAGKPMVLVVGDRVIPIATEQTISIYSGTTAASAGDTVHSGLFAANLEWLCEYLSRSTRRGAPGDR